MIKQGLLAAGLVLTTGAPAFAQSQPMPLQPPPPPPPAVATPTSSTTTIVVAPAPPPPPRAETPPPPDAPHLVWRPGHWAWNVTEAQYVWMPGTYVQPPTVIASWTPGHWERQPGGWMWVNGHW